MPPNSRRKTEPRQCREAAFYPPRAESWEAAPEMTTLAIAFSVLVTSINYSTSVAVTVCTGSMGLRGGPTTDLYGHPHPDDNTLPANRRVDVVLPAPFASSMYCSISSIQRTPKDVPSSRSGADYYRLISCGEKGGRFVSVAMTSTDSKGWERAELSLMEPQMDGRGAILLIDVSWGTDAGVR